MIAYKTDDLTYVDVVLDVHELRGSREPHERRARSHRRQQRPGRRARDDARRGGAREADHRREGERRPPGRRRPPGAERPAGRPARRAGGAEGGLVGDAQAEERQALGGRERPRAARAAGEPAARREQRALGRHQRVLRERWRHRQHDVAGQRAGHVALRLSHPPDPRLSQAPHRHRHRRRLRHAHPRRRQRHRHLRHLDERLRQRDHHRPRPRHLDALRPPVVAGRGHRRAW